MYIKLFDIENEKVIASEHCYTITWLKDIIDAYPDNYTKVFSYLQYMYSWNPDDNPYLAVKEEDREEAILEDLKVDFSTEDDLIVIASEHCKKLFEMPAYRAWKALKKALANLQDFAETQKITTGKDGNGAFIMSAIEKLPGLNKAFNEAYKSYMEDAKIEVRGGKFNSLV